MPMKRQFVLFECIPDGPRETWIAWTIGGEDDQPDARGEVADLTPAERATLSDIFGRVVSKHDAARKRAAEARVERAAVMTRHAHIQELYALHRATKIIEKAEGKAPYWGMRGGQKV